MKHWRFKALLLGSIVSVLLLQACSTTGLYKPPGKGPFPAVIVLSGSGGTRPFNYEFASDLARKGYAVVVVPYVTEPQNAMLPKVIKRELRIINDAYDQLKALPAVDPERIGLVGFSLGANRALLLAANYPDRNIRGIVSYYIGCFGRHCGNKYPSSIYFPAVLFLHGDMDKVSPERIKRYCRWLRRRGYYDCEVHFYEGVDHAFYTVNYNAFAVADAFKRTVAFLDEHVKGKSK